MSILNSIDFRSANLTKRAVNNLCNFGGWEANSKALPILCSNFFSKYSSSKLRIIDEMVMTIRFKWSLAELDIYRYAHVKIKKGPKPYN